MCTTCSANGQRQTETATLNYEILTMWETTTPQKTSRLLMGPELVTKPKSLQAYDDDDDNIIIWYIL